MATCEIKKCACTATKKDTAAEFQDVTYGKGERVHNCSVTKTGGKVCVCTVCGSKK